MNRRWLPLLLLALAALLGATVWYAVAATEQPRPLAKGEHPADSEARSDQQAAPDNDATGSRAASNAVAAGNTESADLVRPGQAGTSGQGGSGTAQGGSGTASTGPGSTSPSGTTGTPKPLTAREQAELQRRTQGRADHNARVTSLREGSPAGQASVLKKSLKPDEWKQQLKEEGLEPPEMVSTPVAGKVMSPLSNEGLANAQVTLLSFLPWPGKPGGSLYTVATTLTTDAKGEFKGDIPAGTVAPLWHAPLGMLVQASGELQGDFRSFAVAQGLPIYSLRPGEFNQLGIFWAPDEPFDVDCNASQYNEKGLKVVCTGLLDPQRWHDKTRDAALALFTATNVNPPLDGAPADTVGRCTLRATWDKKATPYLSLLKDGLYVQTRRCVPAKQASSTSGQPAPEVAKPFNEVVFENAGLVTITGQVVDADGAGVDGAVLVAIGDPTPSTATSDAAGWFEFRNPGPKTTLIGATHQDFVTTLQDKVKPGDAGLRIVFTTRKPVLWFKLRNRYTQASIDQVSMKVIEKIEYDKSGGKPPPPRTQTFELASASGEYVQKAEWLVAAIILEKVGFFPRTINDPISLQAAAGAALEIDLYPGRELNIKPREYTAAQDTTRWFPDPKPENPGIYTAWSNHWIEWQVDFGDAPEQGQEGGSFDILLGCTNQGLVDNQYSFEVEVWVDGTKKGNLSILADSVATQTGRMKLGKLSGMHTIRLVWLNDKWIPEQLDANIRYASLQLLEQP